MFGLKPLLITIGSIASIAGLTSFSSARDRDPEHVWRVSSKPHFPLFTCKQREIKSEGPRWFDSELLITLKFKGDKSDLRNETELVLEGIGNGVSGTGSEFFKNIDKNTKGKKVNLLESFEAGEGQYKQTYSTFILKIWKDTNKTHIGELGSWDSYTYGDNLLCDKILFSANKYEHSYLDTHYMSQGLKDVKFSLENCKSNEANGRMQCSIKIDSPQNVLNWAEDFKPIVIY